MSHEELRSRSPLRYGLVTEQDVALCRVRVKFPDLGQVTSYWLHVPQRRTMLDKGFELPDIGEEVACLMDDWDESGVVLGALYSSADQPAAGMTGNVTYRGWDDGTFVKYDRAAHVLSIALSLVASMQITQANGSELLVDASGNIKSTVAIGKEISFNGDSDALALVSKLVAAFNAHTHGGVQTGTGTTAPPSTPWTASTIESAILKASA